MGRIRAMQRLAKWHIWLGWLVGFPILMWLVTGLVMVMKPIEEVRGTTLLNEAVETPLAADTNIAVDLAAARKPILSVTTRMERNQAVTQVIYLDGTSERFRADGSALAPMSEIEARMIVAERVQGGEKVVSSTRFDANEVPFDFRQPKSVWQVALIDGTHVYVGTDSGAIEAVRTRWWRVFDFMWGLHIMDLQTREDTSHPVLILFAAMSMIGALLGCILMFRRRKARVNGNRNGKAANVAL